MNQEKKQSIGKVSFIYIISSLILIWLFNKILYLILSLSIQAAGASDNLLFNLSWSAYFISGLLSIIIGVKIASSIIKAKYDKNDAHTILRHSIIAYFILNGISLLLNFLSYQKIDINVLFTAISFLTVNTVYYYSTKVFLKK